MDVLVKRWEERQINTVHYNPEIHYASFMLPQWLKESVKEILH
jgi:spermidine synthase